MRLGNFQTNPLCIIWSSQQPSSPPDQHMFRVSMEETHQMVTSWQIPDRSPNGTPPFSSLSTNQITNNDALCPGTFQNLDYKSCMDHLSHTKHVQTWSCWRCDTMSHDLLFCDTMILLDICLTLEGHMTCLHKPSKSIFSNSLWLCHHLFLAHHMTWGHVTHHVTFPTLSTVYIPAGLGFCSLSFSPISCSDFNDSGIQPDRLGISHGQDCCLAISGHQ